MTLSRASTSSLERDGGLGRGGHDPDRPDACRLRVPWAGRFSSGRRTAPSRATHARSSRPRRRNDRSSRRLRSRWTSTHSARVCARFAGVSGAAGGGGATARAQRETMLSSGPLGMVSVAGGKLTTYRRIALAVLHQLRAELELHRIDRRPRPLPGRRGSRRRGRRAPATAPGARPVAVAAHLAGTYGTLRRGGDRAGPLEPLGAGVARGRGAGRCTRANASGRLTVGGRASPAHDARGHRTGLARRAPSRVEELLGS